MRGIMFVKYMFIAVVNGLKTETRRLATSDKHLELICYNGISNEAIFINLQTGSTEVLKPQYKAGELVYIKEPYVFNGDSVLYQYDYNCEDDYKPLKFKNKMFMPSKMSRFKIQIQKVYIERLKDITTIGARNEGIKELLQSRSQLVMNGGVFMDYSKKREFLMDGVSAKKSYQTLWDSINKDVKFSDNPYVWVYEFKLVKN